MQVSAHFFQGNLFKASNSRSFLRDSWSELGVLNQILTPICQSKTTVSQPKVQKRKKQKHNYSKTMQVILAQGGD